MASLTKGLCKYCGKEYTRGGMLRHLSSCSHRKSSLAQEKGKAECGYYQLTISDKYDPQYWLIVEIRETATLEELDEFIRDIWVECCGHLSSFRIGGQLYDSCPDTDYFWNNPPKSMKHRLKNVIAVGDKMYYDYDFGSITELVINVHSYRVGKKAHEKITLLSRNNPIEFICSHCGKNPAAYIDAYTRYDDETIFLCEKCAGTLEDEDIYLLPVCNSPRMGVCGYLGSAIYEDRFEPDEHNE